MLYSDVKQSQPEFKSKDGMIVVSRTSLQNSVSSCKKNGKAAKVNSIHAITFDEKVRSLFYTYSGYKMMPPCLLFSSF